MKKIVCIAVGSLAFSAAAIAQNQPPPDAARKADAQFVSDYEAAKKINDAITAATTAAAAKLERENRPRRIQLQGLTAELQRKIARACADVPQRCCYDEAL